MSRARPWTAADVKAHPRFPGGVPGGHGGEFRDKLGAPGWVRSLDARLSGTPDSPVAHLADAVKSGVSGRDQLHGGNTAETQLVTFRNGTRAVRKKFGDSVHGTPERQVDAEELSALVADAIGVPVPGIVRTAPDEIVMQHIDGTVGADLSWQLDPDSFAPVKIEDESDLRYLGLAGQVQLIGHYGILGPYEPAQGQTFATHAEAAVEAKRLYEQSVSRDAKPADLTEQGLRIGLLDLVIGNGDRNDGNWIKDEHGRIVVIDHAAAWHELDDWPFYVDEFRLFGQEFVDDDANLADHPLTRADMGLVRARVAALEDEFDQRGRRDWWVWTMDRVDIVAKHATGTRDVIA